MNVYSHNFFLGSQNANINLAHLHNLILNVFFSSTQHCNITTPALWNVIFEWFEYNPANHFPEPIAAYLIPPDIEEGETVWIEDLIEHFNDHEYFPKRLKQTSAVWRNGDLEIYSPEDIVCIVG